MGKTVTTYLIDGDPQGPRYVFISNKICQMFVIPRASLKNLSDRSDLQTPAFYILLGGDDDTKPQAYIGETENFKERVKDHDYKKEFWQKALIFISKDAAMTKTDVQYLEHRAIKLAKEVGRFALDENKQTPKAPNLPEYQRDNMNEFFEDICFLTSFIGCRIFDVPAEGEASVYFYINNDKRLVEAKGIYDSSGFTVLKGSFIAKETSAACPSKEKRKRLLAEYTTSIDGKLVLHSNVSFSSPSAAAMFCLGRSANGLTEWQTEDKRTLASVYKID